MTTNQETSEVQPQKFMNAADFLFVPGFNVKGAYLIQGWEGPFIGEGLASIEVQRTTSGKCLALVDVLRAAGEEGFTAIVYDGTRNNHAGARKVHCQFVAATESRHWEDRTKAAHIKVKLTAKVIERIPATA